MRRNRSSTTSCFVGKLQLWGKNSKIKTSETDDWLDNYRDTNEVEGWVDNGAFGFVKLMNSALSRGATSVPGGILEIGVHHGKFFIALNATVEGRSVAMDLYEDQYLNIDHSGRGDRAKFLENLRRFDRHAGRNVQIEAVDSTCANAAEILAKAGEKFRIVSVDGGHTAEHTISDIELANEVVHPLGFVIVDDILNSHWLGVIDGVTSYLRTRPTLWPVAIGFNKLIMCRMSMYPTHRTFFQENFSFSKVTSLCGYEVLSV